MTIQQQSDTARLVNTRDEQMRADVVEELAIALRTQDLMHQKIGLLRKQVQALTAKNKLLRKKLRKLEQHVNKLNERLY